MLNQIRGTANSVFFKIILGIIVVSFLFWGISDVVNQNRDPIMVSFNKLTPIVKSNFLQAKAKELKKIQGLDNINLTEEEIQNSGINQFVLQGLINTKLFEYLAMEYNIDFSNAKLAEFIRSLPQFQDSNNKFNLEKVKAYIAHNNSSQEDFAEEIKNYISYKLINEAFVENAYINEGRFNNIAHFLAESREVDVASFSLTPVKNTATPVADDVLQQFYQEHSALFTDPEQRDICYAKIEQGQIQQNITVTPQEIENYFNENKEEFARQSLVQATKIINTKLLAQKTSQALFEMAKSLEDEVAGGATLEEIAGKYKLERHCLKGVVESNLAPVLKTFKTNIFAMSENEVSYPLEIEGKQEMALIEVTKITPEQMQNFAKVKNKILAEYNKDRYKQQTMESLIQATNNLKASEFKQVIDKVGLIMDKTHIYKRAELHSNKTLPAELLAAMFQGKVGGVVGPFLAEDKIYVAAIYNATTDQQELAKITANSKMNIYDKIGKGLMEEILGSLMQKLEVKIRAD